MNPRFIDRLRPGADPFPKELDKNFDLDDL